ncbi:MAG: DUF2341 domain-containing protein [Planctomycetota bacterium]
MKTAAKNKKAILQLNGSALIIVLLIASVLMTIGIALLDKISVSIRLARTDRLSVKVSYITEAGIERARGRLSIVNDWTDTVLLPDALYSSEPLDGGTYTVTLAERDQDEITVTSVGNLDTYTETLTVRLRASSGWWNQNWKYRKPVEITNNSTENLSDHQVKMQVDYIAGGLNSDFSDLRFTDIVGNPLFYWIESYVASTSAVVWVKIPSIAASGDVTIWMYYGNSVASSASDKNSTMNFIEIGTINLSAQGFPGQWIDSINYSTTFSQPVIFVGPDSTYNNNQQMVIRLRNVTTTGFDLRPQEPSDCNDIHPSETVSWLAIDKGEWVALDGTKILADTYSTGANLHAEAYSVDTSDIIAFKYTLTSPIVLPQIMSYDDTVFAKMRQYNVTGTGLRLGMENEGGSAVDHGIETVGWIAMESAAGTWESIPFEISLTPDTVTDAWYTINFSQSYVAAPAVMAFSPTRDGPDSCEYRGRNLTNVSIQVMVEEDTTNDGETGHANEVMGYFVIGQTGLYPLGKYVSPEPTIEFGTEEAKKGTIIINYQ